MEKESHPAVFKLSPLYGIITVSGERAQTFLQGQLTADIFNIPPQSPLLSAYCNLKGRVRALLWIWQLKPESYALMLPRSILAQTLEVLKQYGRFSRVMLEDRSDDYTMTGFVGTIPDALFKLSRIQLLKLPDPKTPRFICIGHSISDGDLQGDLIEWQALDMRAGIPSIHPQSVELFLPHHLGLIGLGAISFSKGCFCGQEVIARMEYKSTPKRELVYIQAGTYEGPLPEPGALIYADAQSTESIGVFVHAVVYLEKLEALITLQKTHVSIDRLYQETPDGERLLLRPHLWEQQHIPNRGAIT